MVRQLTQIASPVKSQVGLAWATVGTVGIAWKWARPVKDHTNPIPSPVMGDSGRLWASLHGPHSNSAPLQFLLQGHSKPTWVRNGQYGLAHSNPSWAPPGLAIWVISRSSQIFLREWSFITRKGGWANDERVEVEGNCILMLT